MVAAKEISLALPGALRLAGKAWGSPTQSNLRVLAVHVLPSFLASIGCLLLGHHAEWCAESGFEEAALAGQWA